AERSAKLIALQSVSLPGEGIPGIEEVIAHELKGIAMEVIRTGLRSGVDLSARSSGAACGAETAGIDFELLQRVRKRHRHGSAVVCLVVHRSVELIHHAEIHSTGDCDKTSGCCAFIPTLWSGFTGL